MLLHYAQNSRAVRVAWLLEELNLPYTIKKYKLGDKEMREESYKKLNPLGWVPTLEDNELIISYIQKIKYLYLFNIIRMSLHSRVGFTQYNNINSLSCCCCV